jgi:hypothetical protein
MFRFDDQMQVAALILSDLLRARHFSRTLAPGTDAFSRTMTARTGTLSGIRTGLSSLPMADRTRYGTLTAAFRTLNRRRFIWHIVPPLITIKKNYEVCIMN